MAAYIYARVSTVEQVVGGCSIEGQVRSCRLYCEANGLVLGAATNCDKAGVILDGGRSAFSKPFATRPGAMLLAGALRQGDTVVVTSLTRLFRRVAEAATIMERWVDLGVSVTFVDYPSLSFDSANGRCLVYCMAAVAQLKSELIAARVREGRARRKGLPAEPNKPTKPAKPVKVPVPASQQPVAETIRRMAEKQLTARSGQVRIYARVSTDEQSVDTQLAILRQVYPGAVEYVDHGISAWKTSLPDRPEGGRMLRELHPGDTIVVLRPDRVFRSLKDAANQIDAIQKVGAFLHIHEGGIKSDELFGRLLLGMLSAFAQLESEETSRATKHAMAIACGTNDAALQARLPKPLLRNVPPKTQQYVFGDVFDSQERQQMWLTVHLTQANYPSLGVCILDVTNRNLYEKGFPPLTSQSMDMRDYRQLLRQMGTKKAKALIPVIGGYSRVASPVGSSQNFPKTEKRYVKFMAMYRELSREQRDLRLITMMQNPQTVATFADATRRAVETF